MMPQPLPATWWGDEIVQRDLLPKGAFLIPSPLQGGPRETSHLKNVLGLGGWEGVVWGPPQHSCSQGCGVLAGPAGPSCPSLCGSQVMTVMAEVSKPSLCILAALGLCSEEEGVVVVVSAPVC